MIFFKNILVIVTIILWSINSFCAVKLGHYRFKKNDDKWVYASGKNKDKCVTNSQYLEKLNQLSDDDSDDDSDTLSWPESESRSKSSKNSSSKDSSSASWVEDSSSEDLSREDEEENCEQSCFVIDADTNKLFSLHSSKKLTKHNQSLIENPDLIKQINTLLENRREQFSLDNLNSGTQDDLKDADALLQALEKSLLKFCEKPLRTVTLTGKGQLFYEFGNDDNDLGAGVVGQALVQDLPQVTPHENFVNQELNNDQEASSVIIEFIEEYSWSDYFGYSEIKKPNYEFLDIDTGIPFFFNNDSKELAECDQMLTKNPNLIKEINIFLAAKRRKLDCQADLNSDMLVLFQDLIKLLSQFYTKPLHSIIQDKNGFYVYKFGNDDGSEHKYVNGDGAAENLNQEKNIEGFHEQKNEQEPQKTESLNQSNNDTQANLIEDTEKTSQEQVLQNKIVELDEDKNNQTDNNQITRKESSRDLEEKRKQNNLQNVKISEQVNSDNNAEQQNNEIILPENFKQDDLEEPNEKLQDPISSADDANQQNNKIAQQDDEGPSEQPILEEGSDEDDTQCSICSGKWGCTII